MPADTGEPDAALRKSGDTRTPTKAARSIGVYSDLPSPGSTLFDQTPRQCDTITTLHTGPRNRHQMRKVLTYLVIGATLVLAGCSTQKKTDLYYRSSPLERLPFVYKMTVQQGNIVTEEMVDRLEPGMSKSQVRFLLGTPMLTDLFHTDRWDYTYTIRRGHSDLKTTQLTLFFEEDSLVRVEGDLRPDPDRAARREPADLLVSVPDWEDKRGFFGRTASKLGAEPKQ